MKQKEKHLVVLQDNSVVPGTTCFATHAKHNVDCQRTRCKNWIEHSDSNNCVIIAAKNGPHTLQDIGSIYGLTRMRICQIEKEIFEKIRNAS